MPAPVRHTPSVTRGEDIASAASHGLGLVASLAGGTLLVLSAAGRGSWSSVVGAAVFAVTVVLLYGASTIYHALPLNHAKHACRVIDHSAIYLLIAGTYTPFCLGVLRGAWGWTLLGMVWGLAATGVLLRTTASARYARLSTGLYLPMGWLVAIAVRPLLSQLPPAGLAWLVSGGLLYTGGLAFFVAPRLRYAHFVWHLFVLGGTVCHFFAVLWYSS